MLKDKLIGYLRRLPAMAGLEISFDDKGYTLKGVELLRQGRSVVVGSRVEPFADISMLKGKLDNSIPIVLVVSGKGIIHRVVPHQAMSETDVIKSLIPGAKKGEYYIQEFEQPTGSWFSLIRKSQLDNLLKTFNDIGFQVVMVSLGAYQVLRFRHLLQGLETNDDQLIINEHCFSLEGEKLTRYQLLSSPSGKGILVFGDEEMNAQYMVSYVQALSAISGIDPCYVPLPELGNQYQELGQKYQFRRTGAALLALFLLLLLLNSFFFLRYAEAIEGLPLAMDTKQLEELTALKERAESERNLLKVISGDEVFLSAPRSIIVDQLCAILPHDITLNEVTVGTKDQKATQTERKPVYNSTALLVQGHTTNLQALHHWIKEVNMMPFVATVSLQAYRYDAREDQGIFSVIANLKEE